MTWQMDDVFAARSLLLTEETPAKPRQTNRLSALGTPQQTTALAAVHAIVVDDGHCITIMADQKIE